MSTDHLMMRQGYHRSSRFNYMDLSYKVVLLRATSLCHFENNLVRHKVSRRIKNYYLNHKFYKLTLIC